MARHRPPPLLRTPPGVAIAAGVAVKLLIALIRLATPSVPAVVGLVDAIAGLSIAGGTAYFLIRLFLIAKRRLLWRVRRKLILSYVFIGVVPALLIAAFFVLGALLLFFNFSSYLLQSEVRLLSDRVRLLATSAALGIQQDRGRDVPDVLARTLSGLQSESPSASVAVVPVARACAQVTRPGADTADFKLQTGGVRLGPWSHVSAPTAVPAWVDCDGFTGLLATAGAGSSVSQLFVRGIAFPLSSMPGYAVVVDLPIDMAMRERMRREIGIDVRDVAAVGDGEVNPIPAADAPASETAGRANPVSGPLTWVTFVDYRDWTTGKVGSLLVTTQLNLQDIYARLAAAQGVVGNRPFGQALLLVLLVVVGGLFFVIEVVALVVGLALARSITGSVHELFEGTERVREGDFSHKIAITANDQLGELAASFNSMTSSIERLLREAAEKKRLEEELRIAHEIQMSLLPQGPLNVPGLSAAAVCIPAREVGGDYYDFLALGDGRVGILIADVAGKGTSAALYMAQLKGLVLSLSRMHLSPRVLLVTANRIIAEHVDSRSFITITYAVVDLHARTMTYARAGHTPLIHVPAARNSERHARVLAPSGMVVGLRLADDEMFERLLEEEVIPLQTGDLYVFFTDGISEAMNAADDCFGEARLGRLVEENANLPSEELRERVLHEVAAFVDGAAQHDDMTMILLKVEAQQADEVGEALAAVAGHR